MSFKRGVISEDNVLSLASLHPQRSRVPTKTDESSFGNSNYLPVLITVSAKYYVDDLFRDPGEASESMQGSVRGDTELTLPCT